MNDARTGAFELVLKLRDAGFEAYWVGGCVRDMLLQREPKDYDIATNALPDQVLTLFPGGHAVGRAFGVILVPDSGKHVVEIATFREDHGTVDGRHPQRVSFSDARADALRRDFTVNAMFMDPVTNKILDYVGGRDDIARRLIRTVGDPQQRFEEDYLRLLRAIRFAATLQFAIEPATADAIKKHATRIIRVSADRVRIELTRLLLEAPRAGDGVDLLDQSGLLDAILPEVSAMKGVEQPAQFHPEGDVWTHTRIMLNAMQTDDPRLAWAVWLHDIGKPPTATEIDGRIRFDRHAGVGADMADTILRRLRFANRDRETIVTCIRGHMRFADVPQMRPARLRRWMAQPEFPIELELHRLDCQASHKKDDSQKIIETMQHQLANRISLPERWIRGEDILELGLPPGPEIGYWLQEAYDAQLNGISDSRDELLKWLRHQIAGRIQTCRNGDYLVKRKPFAGP